MITFSHFYVGSMLCYVFAAIHHCTSYSAIFSGNQTCRTRRFLQNSTGLAGLDGSCRTRRVLPDSTVLAELDGSCRTRRFLQNSTGLAGLDGSCRTRRVLQDSTVLAELGRFCRFITHLAATAPHISRPTAAMFIPMIQNILSA